MEPLKGIRVLDASHVVAGPFATYQLCLLGAEVIRVDRVEGPDFVRFHRGTEAMKEAGLGASFVSQNAGKTCIQLDLKDPRGIDLFKRLAATADVVLENFRPGVMERLGLGYDDIRKVKPDIVYCSLTGYGPNGPMRGSPAYDHIVQGFSGLMSTTGTEETGPLRSGIPITDYLAGINGAFAILSALYQHNLTGQGQHLQVTMLGATLPTLGAAIADYQTTGHKARLMGNQPFSDSPFAGRFDTADGQLVVTANTGAQAQSLIATLGITSLDEELADTRAGKTLTPEQKSKISAALTQAFAKDSALTWEERLGAASVPAGKVRSIDEIIAHPQVEAVGCMDPVPVPGVAEKINVPGLAFSNDSGAKRDLSAPEPAGASTARILQELGLDGQELDTLARAGVIAGPDLPQKA